VLVSSIFPSIVVHSSIIPCANLINTCSVRILFMIGHDLVGQESHANFLSGLGQVVLFPS
jgi:hypothetical protein